MSKSKADKPTRGRDKASPQQAPAVKPLGPSHSGAGPVPLGNEASHSVSSPRGGAPHRRSRRVEPLVQQAQAQARARADATLGRMPARDKATSAGFVPRDPDAARSAARTFYERAVGLRGELADAWQRGGISPELSMVGARLTQGVRALSALSRLRASDWNDEAHTQLRMAVGSIMHVEAQLRPHGRGLQDALAKLRQEYRSLLSSS